MDVELHWLSMQHLGPVSDIAADTFDNPWTRKQYAEILSRLNVMGLVAVAWPGRVLGYNVFAIQDNRIDLLCMAVESHHRRRGIGRKLFGRLSEFLSPQRSALYFEVQETNLAAHLFFKAQGARALGLTTSQCGASVTGWVHDYTPTGAEVWERVLSEDDACR